MANKAPLIHIASQIFETPLAITQGKLEVILNAIGPRLGTEALSFDSALDLSHCRVCGGTGVRFNAAIGGERCAPCGGTGRSKIVAYWDDDEDDFSSSEKKKPYTVTDAGVAVIPITGTLMETGGWMSALSGCSSYEGITKAVKMAMDEDNTVKGILFRVNSPGGSTHGCFELCDLIHSYRGKKPMYAIAKHLAASAGYALASCADEVHVTLTGAVGSVGVFALHCDQSKRDKEVGLKYTYIHYGAKKVDGNAHAPLSDSATADLQAEVDRQGELFVSRVARNRSTTAKKIAATEAGCFYADGAIPLFADKVSTYDECLAALTSRVSGNLSTGRSVTILKSQTATSNSDPMEEEDDECDPDQNPDTQTDEDCGKKVKNAESEVLKTMADTNNPTQTIPAANATSAATTTGAAAPVPTAPAPAAPTQAAPNPAPIPVAASPAPAQSASQVIPMPAPAGEAPYDYLAVMNLCNLSGFPELAAKFAEEKKPLAQVIAALQTKRAGLSDDTQVNNGFVSVNSDSISAVVSQTNAIATVEKLTRPQAFIRLLSDKPELYEAYENDRQAAMDKRNRSGRLAYLKQVANQCQALGLSRGGY